MEYMTVENDQTCGKILCCECGTQIDPNPANMCVGCIRTKVDITEGIPKQAQIYFCKFCQRYLQPPATWIPAQLESKELLALCLKRLKGLKEVRLTDAGFIWTEPHSKRIRLKITVQKEVMGGAVLQQVVLVEYVVINQMCSDCQRIEAKDYWRAVVQVRQKTDHKKTMYFLEQIILKHNLHKSASFIKTIHGGIDFYYSGKQDAVKLVEFLQTVLPCKYQHSQQLVTHDAHNNTFDYKHTYSVELVPICKDNIVCLPKQLANSLGNLSQLCICYRVSNLIHLIDPFSTQIAELNSTQYWRNSFDTLSHSKHLTEYTVIDVETMDAKMTPGHGQTSHKHQLAEVHLMRSTELGSTDAKEYFLRTHLGHLLQPGDTVLGFDLANANTNNTIFDQLKRKLGDQIPDVILIKKVYDRTLRSKHRRWKLKHLEENIDSASTENDYNEFLEDLEEDVMSRKHVNIFKDAEKLNLPPIEADEEIPQISLQEMLDDLHIEDQEMKNTDDENTV